MSYVISSLLLVNLLSFAWSVTGVFSKGNPDSRFTLLKISWAINAVVSMHATIVSHVGTIRALLTLLILAGSMLLFWSAAFAVRENPPTVIFSNDIPSFIVHKGPFLLVRHPFYTAYMSTFVAVSIYSSSYLVVVTSCLIACFYVIAAFAEENKFSDSVLHEDYIKYASRTGMFIPKMNFFLFL